MEDAEAELDRLKSRLGAEPGGRLSHGGSHGVVEKSEPTPRTFSTPA
jgi:hypothetical protein